MKQLVKTLIRSRESLAVLGLFLLSVGFFAHLFYPTPKIFSTAEIGINDIWYLNFPLKNFLSEQLKAGKLPTWDPYRNGGFPDLAEGQIGTFNFYNLIAFRFLPAIHAFNIGYIVMFFQCALGLYLFCRRKNLSHLISFYAGAVYAFSGFFVTHISHFVLLQTASYFPLLLYATDLLLTKPNVLKIIFWAVIFSQQLFAGFPQLTFISLLGVGAYALFELFTKKANRIVIVSLLLSVGLGTLLSAAQLLPTLELIPISSRDEGISASEILFYRFPVEHLLAFLYPFAFGNPQLGTYPHFRDFKGSLFWENTGYVGIIPLLLVLVLLFSWTKLKRHVFYLGLSLISFLLMLGGKGPLYILLLFPPFSFFRFPSRFLLLFVFALIMLSAHGLEHLSKRLKKRRLVVLTTTIAIVNVLFIWYNYHPTVPFTEYSHEPEVVSFIKSQPHGKIYTYLANTRTWEEFFRSGSSIPKRYLDLREEIAPNINMIYHLASSDAYASSLTPKRHLYYNSFVASPYKIASASAILDQRSMNLLSMRNTTHIISPIPLHNSNLSLVFTQPLKSLPDQQNAYVYENKSALPKYYAVNQFRTVTSIEDFMREISSSDFDLKKEALVESSMSGVSQTIPLTSTISVLAESEQKVLLNVNFNQPAILVITNSYDRNWQIRIDEKKANIFPVNLINQGAIIPANDHLVELMYQSSSIDRGVLISILGYFVILCIFVFYIIFYRRKYIR